MAVHDILKMGDARLLRVAQPVPEIDFDSDALHLLISDLLDTMRAVNGAGLAAPQIGVDLQLVIFGSNDFNPRYPDRPAEQIDLNVNQSFRPTIVGPSVGTGPRVPPVLFRTNDYWAQGVNFGLLYRY